MKWVEQGRHPAGRALDGAHHLAVQRGQGGDGVLRPLVPRARSPRASTTAWRRCPRVDEAGGKPMRPWMTVEGVYVAAPSKNKDAAYEFAQVPHRRRRPAKILALEGRQSAGQQGGLRRPAGGGGSDAQGVPQAGRRRRAHAQRAGDDDGLVAGDHGDERRSSRRRPRRRPRWTRPRRTWRRTSPACARSERLKIRREPDRPSAAASRGRSTG